MRNGTFTFSFSVTGLERKQVAHIIAEAIDVEVEYAGAPTFRYLAGGWVIDRESTVTSPEIPIGQKGSLRQVFEALKIAGAKVEGDGTVTLSLGGHDGNSLRNAVNLIWAKQYLIQKSLGRERDIVPASLVEAINAVPIVTLEEFAEAINGGIDAGLIVGDSDLDFDLTDQTISFSFFNASLDADEVGAFLTLCYQISGQAKKQKFSSTKQKEAPNESYAMRCFLLKLGFIGTEFKTERKVLLARLSGNSSFRTEQSRLLAEEKRKARSTQGGAK